MAADRIVLDTSGYSHLRRAHEGVIALISAAHLVYLPVTVLGELEGGFRAGSRYAANEQLLAEFIEEAFVEVLPTTRGVAARYGEVFAALRAAGTPIPMNDIWIAAHTLEAGAHLVTFDRDFERVAGLPLTLLSATAPAGRSSGP